MLLSTFSGEELLSATADSPELLTLKVRYKHLEAQESRLLTHHFLDQPRLFSEASSDFQFAAAVAAFGMLLRNSPHGGDAGYEAVREIAAAASTHDPHGHRGEFLEMVDAAQHLTRRGIVAMSKDE